MTNLKRGDTVYIRYCHYPGRPDPEYYTIYGTVIGYLQGADPSDPNTAVLVGTGEGDSVVDFHVQGELLTEPILRK